MSIFPQSNEWDPWLKSRQELQASYFFFVEREVISLFYSASRVRNLCMQVLVGERFFYENSFVLLLILLTKKKTRIVTSRTLSFNDFKAKTTYIVLSDLHTRFNEIKYTNFFYVISFESCKELFVWFSELCYVSIFQIAINYRNS